MNRPMPLLVLASLLLMLLSGCARHYYGVPEDDWHRMNQHERSEIIRIYQERKLHQERRRAAEAQMQNREMARHRHYPEWINVYLSDGVFHHKGKRYAYQAHDLRLRRGEVRIITLVSINTKKPRYLKLRVRYDEGKVMLGDGKRYLQSFDYRDSWKEEERYKGVKLRGGLHMDGVNLVIGSKPRRHKADSKHESKQHVDKWGNKNTPSMERVEHGDRAPERNNEKWQKGHNGHEDNARPGMGMTKGQQLERAKAARDERNEAREDRIETRQSERAAKAEQLEKARKEQALKAQMKKKRQEKRQEKRQAKQQGKKQQKEKQQEEKQQEEKQQGSEEKAAVQDKKEGSDECEEQGRKWSNNGKGKGSNKGESACDD